MTGEGSILSTGNANRMFGLQRLSFVLPGTSRRLGPDQRHHFMWAARRAADVPAVKRLTEAWDAAWRAGDAQALAGLFTEDAVLMPQNQPAVMGKEAILALYRSLFEEVAVTGTGEVLEIQVAGDWAIVRSIYGVSATPKAGGDMITDTGKCIIILRRQRDTSWKIARLIANTDLPLSRN